MSPIVLILHASVATGHGMAARALEKAFRQCGVERVEVFDTLDFGSKLFHTLYAKLYVDIAERTPKLWGAYYGFFLKDSQFKRSLRHLYSHLGVNTLSILNKLSPDAILCTHFLPIDAGVDVASRSGSKPLLYCVMTDYGGHPFWAYPQITGTFVGSEMTADMLANYGVPRPSIHVTGIPIDPAIIVEKDVAVIRQQRQLNDGPVVTLICSGISSKKVHYIINGLLSRNIAGTLFVVAGRNYTLQDTFQYVQSASALQIRQYGFIDYLDDLIAVSDLVITKSGGLTISEAMARGTPLLIVEPFRGQEEYNADYVLATGAGIQARVVDSVPYIVESLLQDSARLTNMRLHAKMHGRPRAAVDIANEVLDTI